MTPACAVCALGFELDHVAVLRVGQRLLQAVAARHPQRAGDGRRHVRRQQRGHGAAAVHASSAQAQPSRATMALDAAGPQLPAA
jgi:hypothetical protein